MSQQQQQQQQDKEEKVQQEKNRSKVRSSNLAIIIPSKINLEETSFLHVHLKPSKGETIETACQVVLDTSLPMNTVVCHEYGRFYIPSDQDTSMKRNEFAEFVLAKVGTPKEVFGACVFLGTNEDGKATSVPRESDSFLRKLLKEYRKSKKPTKKRKRTTSTGPRKPVRPKTAVQLYAKEVKPTLDKELTGTKLKKHLQESFDTLSSEEKLKYTKLEEEDVKRYDSQFKQYELKKQKLEESTTTTTTNDTVMTTA